jgi:hypothetical protein
MTQQNSAAKKAGRQTCAEFHDRQRLRLQRPNPLRAEQREWGPIACKTLRQPAANLNPVPTCRNPALAADADPPWTNAFLNPAIETNASANFKDDSM